MLKQQRSAKIKNQSKKETLQYKSGMGLKPTVQNQQTGQKRKQKNNQELITAKKFKCDSENCIKCYVSKSGLKQHQQIKHVNK